MIRFSFLVTLVFVQLILETRVLIHARTFDSRRGPSISSCQNTQSGKYYLADSQGKVCKRDSFDYMTGCCRNGLLYSCETCESDSCCSRYENCVSCCLKPQNEASKKYLTAYRIRNHEESGAWANEFEYCQGICRTWTHSTVHENAFIDMRRFCFSEFGRALIAENKMPYLPSKVALEKSEEGKDCTTTCKSAGKTCDPSSFLTLNNCDLLREHFICEAGCGEIEESRGNEPYYITEAAQKREFPAYCVSHSTVSDTVFDCEWAAANVRRLCPCSEITR